MTDARGRGVQYALLVVQVALVGMAAGSVRTALPALAADEFGMPGRAPALLATIVVAFGALKAAANLGAGYASDRFGRRRTLLLGWACALPVPAALWLAPSWWWVVAATGLLGVNQGLAWSASLTAKLDLSAATRRGLTNGVNEFAGYTGVALAGYLTAALASDMGGRGAVCGLLGAVAIVALASAAVGVRETTPTGVEGRGASAGEGAGRAIALRRDRRMVALCQVGLVEKFVDALVWLAFPALLLGRGVSLAGIGVIVGVYSLTWGGAQLLLGPMSDRVGRKPLIFGGMLACAAGAAAMPVAHGAPAWTACAALMGVGMAALYPTLGASVADIAPARERGRWLGVYRFWRDLGYAVGAAVIGLSAYASGAWGPACAVVSACVGVSAVAYAVFGAETVAVRARQDQAPAP